MYHAYGLLLPNSDFTLAAAAQKLAVMLPEFQQQQAGQRLELFSGAWEMHLTLQDGPEVLQESLRIAEHIGGAEDELGIRTCNRRVDIASDVPDPEMDHFNDYLRVIEALQTFQGVIPVDPREPSLL
jgi:hypothetical protein